MDQAVSDTAVIRGEEEGEKLKEGVRKRPIPGFCQKAFLFNHNFDAFEGFSAA